MEIKCKIVKEQLKQNLKNVPTGENQHTLQQEQDKKMTVVHGMARNISNAIVQDWPDHERNSVDTLRDWWAHFQVELDREWQFELIRGGVQMHQYIKMIEYLFRKRLRDLGT